MRACSAVSKCAILLMFFGCAGEPVSSGGSDAAGGLDATADTAPGDGFGPDGSVPDGGSDPGDAGNTTDVGVGADTTASVDTTADVDLVGSDAGLDADSTDTGAPDATGPANVGPEGGTVVLASGALVIEVPAGAVAEPTALTATPASGFPKDARLVPGTAWELGPAGLAFTSPVTVTISFAPADVPTGVETTSLRLGRVTAGTWTDVLPAVVGPTTVSGEATGFSTWGVLTPPGNGATVWVVDSAPPGSSTEFETLDEAVSALCLAGGGQVVLARSTPTPVGTVVFDCAVEMVVDEGADGTLLPSSGLMTFVSSGPLSLAGLTLGGAALVEASSDVSFVDCTGGATTVSLLGAASPPAAAPGAPLPTGCRTVRFDGGGFGPLAVGGSAGGCAAVEVASTTAPTLTLDGAVTFDAVTTQSVQIGTLELDLKLGGSLSLDGGSAIDLVTGAISTSGDATVDLDATPSFDLDLGGVGAISFEAAGSAGDSALRLSAADTTLMLTGGYASLKLDQNAGSGASPSLFATMDGTTIGGALEMALGAAGGQCHVSAKGAQVKGAVKAEAAGDCVVLLTEGVKVEGGLEIAGKAGAGGSIEVSGTVSGGIDAMLTSGTSLGVFVKGTTVPSGGIDVTTTLGASVTLDGVTLPTGAVTIGGVPLPSPGTFMLPWAAPLPPPGAGVLVRDADFGAAGPGLVSIVNVDGPITIEDIVATGSSAYGPLAYAIRVVGGSGPVSATGCTLSQAGLLVAERAGDVTIVDLVGTKSGGNPSPSLAIDDVAGAVSVTGSELSTAAGAAMSVLGSTVNVTETAFHVTGGGAIGLQAAVGGKVLVGSGTSFTGAGMASGSKLLQSATGGHVSVSGASFQGGFVSVDGGGCLSMSGCTFSDCFVSDTTAGLATDPVTSNSGLDPSFTSTKCDFDGNGCADYPPGGNTRVMNECVIDGVAPTCAP